MEVGILSEEEAEEMKKFVDFRKGIQGNVDETLVCEKWRLVSGSMKKRMK